MVSLAVSSLRDSILHPPSGRSLSQCVKVKGARDRLLPKRSGNGTKLTHCSRKQQHAVQQIDVEQRSTHLETTFALVASRLNVLLGKNRN